MPDDASFEMTYPCHILKDKFGRPELVEIDQVLCVCLFTERDALQAFYNDKYRDKSEPTFRCFVFESAEVLLRFFATFKASFVKQGVNYVAVNTKPGSRPMYAPLLSFLEYLKSG